MNFSVMKRKEVKELVKWIDKQWNFKGKLDYGFLINAKSNVYIVKKEVFDVDFSKIRINSLGMYLGELRNGELRLSIEGSQIIGKGSDKNIADIEDTRAWLRGEDLELVGDYSGFVIIRHNKDFLGCGRYKEGKILNFVPKARRLKCSD